MFANGFVRVQLDRYDCYFNFNMKLPNRLQMDWLKTFCMLNSYVLKNGDIDREVSLEQFLDNPGNRRFYEVIEEARRKLNLS